MNKCDEWKLNKLTNPQSGRRIKQNGVTYRRFQLLCGPDDMCQRWHDRPVINPYTGRKIKQGGPTFKLLESAFLDRFVKAQNGVYKTVLAELKKGKKVTHWIWYIFPQLVGLGTSSTSNYYSIYLDEAISYLRHPVLGPRYMECVKILTELNGKTIRDIFGSDDVKVHASLTLFYIADPSNQLIQNALVKYFSGHLHMLTESRV